MKKPCLAYCAAVACSLVAAFLSDSLLSWASPARAEDGPTSTVAQKVAHDQRAPDRTDQPAKTSQAAKDKKPAADNTPPVDKNTASQSDGAKGRTSADAADEQKFVRTINDDKGKPVVLQTAIVTYKADSGPYVGIQVDLIGAIHIADKQYFQKLNELFKGYDALLYEMVADPDAVKQVSAEAKDRSAVSAVQSGMKDMLGLSFQLDEVDYQAKNFVHADMNPSEFTASLSERREGIMQFLMRSMGSSMALQGSGKSNDLDMLTALFSSNRELALKRVLATQIEQMDGQLAAISGEDGKSTLITERNRKALDVLKREIDSGKKKLGIFYGAGHFRDMSDQLEKRFQMRPVKTQWIDAWNMR